jgi:hypothetical protein
MNTTTTKIAGEAMTDERATFKEFRAALCRMNDANTPVSVADRVMILSNATFLLDEYARAAAPTAPAQSCGDAEQADEAVTYDDVSICDAHGIDLPVEYVEHAVAIANFAARAKDSK